MRLYVGAAPLVVLVVGGAWLVLALIGAHRGLRLSGRQTDEKLRGHLPQLGRPAVQIRLATKTDRSASASTRSASSSGPAARRRRVCARIVQVRPQYSFGRPLPARAGIGPEQTGHTSATSLKAGFLTYPCFARDFREGGWRGLCGGSSRHGCAPRFDRVLWGKEGVLADCRQPA